MKYREISFCFLALIFLAVFPNDEEVSATNIKNQNESASYQPKTFQQEAMTTASGKYFEAN